MKGTLSSWFQTGRPSASTPTTPAAAANNIGGGSSTNRLTGGFVSGACDTAANAVTAAPTPASSHSLDSPSPSPQPPTPEDYTTSASSYQYIVDGTDPAVAAKKSPQSLQALQSQPRSIGPSQPIGIISSSRRVSDDSKRISSPLARKVHFGANEPDFGNGFNSQLESQFEQASQDQLDLELTNDSHVDSGTTMTAGPGLEPLAGPPRHDSFVSAGPKPITVNAAGNRDYGFPRRESLAGSLMNGMSWGGISVGSLIKEDMMMTGTSPFVSGQQSSSFHSNSYIAKKEAEYLRNFICCNQNLENMHDLLRHYETHHHNNPSAVRSGNQMGARSSLGRMSVTSMGMNIGGGRQDSSGFLSPGQYGHQGPLGGSHGFGHSGLGRGSSMDHSTRHSQLLNMQTNDDLDTVGDMEMDDAVENMEFDDNSHQRTMQQTRQLFGQQQGSQLHLNMGGAPLAPHGLRSPQHTTPGTAGFFQNNPTVSSVNTPTLTTQQSMTNQSSSQPGGAAHGSEADMTAMAGNLNLNNLGSHMNTGFGQDLQHFFIDDPAKRLCSPNGSSQNQRALQQQMAQYGLDRSQFGDVSDPQSLALLQRALSTDPVALVLPHEEDKPFKCPVIGCEKAYKNQNGLKYHKQHGHSTQQLHENGDGTFSILNPETAAPYPGELGMEKEKPHKCEWCSKRYKNLNGLKYHKTHSPACELAAQAAGFKAAIAAGSGSNPMRVNMPNLPPHGLPGIGEDMQM